MQNNQNNLKKKKKNKVGRLSFPNFKNYPNAYTQTKMFSFLHITCWSWSIGTLRTTVLYAEFTFK